MRTRKLVKRATLLVALLVIGGLLLATGCAAPPPAAQKPPAAQPTTPPQVQPTTAPQAQPTAAPQAQPTAAPQAQRDYILIGRPNPATGPLAAFGESTPWVDERALAAINKDGGIFIKELNKKLPVKIKVLDTESSPTKASEVAGRLILNDKVDLMVAFGTPDTVNPVSATCERYKVPCVSSLSPIEPWLDGGPYTWSYLHLFTVDQLTDMFMGLFDGVADKTNKKVGLLFPNDPDGMAWQKIFSEQMPKRGYTVVDPGRWPYGTKDFTAVITKFKDEKVELLTGTLLAPDFATFWRQSKQLGYTPKVATIGKAAVFPADINALGENLPNGITAEAWWTPEYTYKSSIDGESAADLADAWSKATGKQWNGTLGAKVSAYEVVYDALKRAQTLDKDKIREALNQTDLPTMIGRVKYNDKHFAAIPVVGAQWQKGTKWPWDQVIVWNPKYPDLPKKTADMVFPIPQ